MDLRVLPVRIGLLHDFPQADSLFPDSLRLGIEDGTAGRLDREVELVGRQVRGLPFGTEAEVRRGFAELDTEEVLAVVGPSISDNCLIARECADEAGLPSINYSGGERTRGEWMFHYQVGSLEEEPIVLAERLAERGLGRAAVVHDHSPVGRGYLAHFLAAGERLGVEVTGTAAVSAVAAEPRPLLERLRAAAPEALVYLGLGAASHAVATARADLGWDVPVVANSALMFGYARPDWRDAWAGWEYVDTIADDNPQRRALAERDGRAAAGPIGCAAYDIGRLLGEALVRCDHLTRAGVAEGLRSVKRLPATSGATGTIMGFGVRDHAALKGEYLVLRTWRDGRSVPVDR